MSVLDSGDVDAGSMSPLDDVASPQSVRSELMVTDMLDSPESPDVKRKPDLEDKKFPTLATNNNDVRFVLQDNDEGSTEKDVSFGRHDHTQSVIRIDVDATEFLGRPSNGRGQRRFSEYRKPVFLFAFFGVRKDAPIRPRYFFVLVQPAAWRIS